MASHLKQPQARIQPPEVVAVTRHDHLIGPARTPTKLFDTRYFSGGSGRSYDVSPDGQRFRMIKPGTEQAPSMVVVLNWLEELKAKLPAK